jgi:hypothetical protein
MLLGSFTLNFCRKYDVRPRGAMTVVSSESP